MTKNASRQKSRQDLVLYFMSGWKIPLWIIPTRLLTPKHSYTPTSRTVNNRPPPTPGGTKIMPILSPSAEATIENCIPVLEAYTDLESIISLAQTCRTLHRLFVDNDTNRIKVTHFEVESFPLPHSTSLVLTTAAPVKNWRTAPARIPHYYRFQII